MTIREKMMGMMEQNGLWGDDARAVMEAAAEDPSLGAFAERWNDHVEDYPPVTISIVWLSTQRVAAKWIAANKPMHFARSLFEAAL